jgi:hypothetical protein
MFRQLVLSKIPQLVVLDAQHITDLERTNACQSYSTPAAISGGGGALGAGGDFANPFSPQDYAAVMLGSAGGLERLSGGGIGSSGSIYASGFGGGMGAAVGGKMSTQGKLSLLMPAALNYDALSSQLQPASGALQPGLAGYSLGGLGASVPSIQSGTLVLSGANAFGLEGTAIGGSNGGGNQGGVNGTQRPYSGVGAASKRRGSLVGVGALSGRQGTVGSTTSGRTRASEGGSYGRM